jgi:NADH dehydrogenase FAD-containing subunit
MISDVVVGGGGVIAVELAGNMCELINKSKWSQFKCYIIHGVVV